MMRNQDSLQTSKGPTAAARDVLRKRRAKRKPNEDHRRSIGSKNPHLCSRILCPLWLHAGRELKKPDQFQGEEKRRDVRGF